MSSSVWRVRPAHSPRVLRRCPGCDVTRPFASSGRFRVNGQKRRLDVWLIYKCVHCDATWNRTVLERVTPESIDPARYQQLVSQLRKNHFVSWIPNPEPGVRNAVR